MPSLSLFLQVSILCGVVYFYIIIYNNYYMKIQLSVTIDEKAMLPFMAIEKNIIAKGKYRANMLSDLILFLSEKHNSVLEEYLSLK